MLIYIYIYIYIQNFKTYARATWAIHSNIFTEYIYSLHCLINLMLVYIKKITADQILHQDTVLLFCYVLSLLPYLDSLILYLKMNAS